VKIGRLSADTLIRMITRFLVCAVLLATAAPLGAQGLADVARAEEARRKSVKGQVKVYTNDTLRGSDGGDAPAAPAPSPAGSPATGVPATAAVGGAAQPGASQPVKPAPAKPADGMKDEKFWRERIGAARDALSRSQTFADALQTQINGLYTEFVNMSDPAQRAVIEKKRLAAIAEQDRVKADLVRQTKALADIEDEARRANVPAGWLR
jgi:hypothetical protein